MHGNMRIIPGGSLFTVRKGVARGLDTSSYTLDINLYDLSEIMLGQPETVPWCKLHLCRGGRIFSIQHGSSMKRRASISFTGSGAVHKNHVFLDYHFNFLFVDFLFISYFLEDFLFFVFFAYINVIIDSFKNIDTYMIFK